MLLEHHAPKGWGLHRFEESCHGMASLQIAPSSSKGPKNTTLQPDIDNFGSLLSFLRLSNDETSLQTRIPLEKGVTPLPASSRKFKNLNFAARLGGRKHT